MEKKHSRFREQHKSRPVGGKEHEVLLREVRRQMELEYSERERGVQGKVGQQIGGL